MRVLIIAPLFPPAEASGALRPHAWANAWARAGEDVTVLTTRKRGAPCVLEAPYRVAEIDAPRPIAVRALAPPPPIGAQAPPAPPASGARGALYRFKSRTGVYGSARMPDTTGPWVARALRWALAQPPFDVAVATSGPYTALLVGEALKRRGHARRFVADFRDLWTANPILCGLPVVRARERALERRVLRAADLVTTVSEPLAAWFTERTGTPVRVVRNGFTGEVIAVPPAPPAGDVRVVHTGSVYPLVQDTDAVCRALGACPPGVRLVLAGDRLAETWGGAIARAGVAPRVEMVGRVSREHALRLQEGAHALLALGFGAGAWSSIPTKLYEYLRAGPPVIVAGGRRESPMVALVERCGRGVWVEGDDTAALARAMTDLWRHPPEPDLGEIAALHRDAGSRALLDAMRSLG